MLTTHQFTAMLRELLADAIMRGRTDVPDQFEQYSESTFEAADGMMQVDSRVAHLLNSLPTGGI